MFDTTFTVGMLNNGGVVCTAQKILTPVLKKLLNTRQNVKNYLNSERLEMKVTTETQTLPKPDEQSPVSKRECLKWQRATIDHIPQIYRLAHYEFGQEIDTYMTPSPPKFKYLLAQSILTQLYDPNRELLIVAHIGDRFIGYAWLARGETTTFSDDEIASYRFIHCVQDVSARIRYTLIKEALEQGILWCAINKIPVLCSTSIRAQQSAFMKIHDKLNFIIRGSYAWMRITPL